MNTEKNAPEIDFDALAAEDDAHFASFKLNAWDYVLVAMLAGLFAVVFLQFFTRYVLNDSVAWTEEAARYLLILLSFAGAIRCQAMGSHIALEFVDKYYGRALGAVHLVGLILTFLLFTIIAWSTLELIQRTSFQQMVSLPFPKYYLHASVFLLLLGNLIVIAAQIFGRIRTLGAR